MIAQQNPPVIVYVGAYAQGESEGISFYRMDPETGALERAGLAAGVANPSFLTVAPGQRFLYAVNEVSEFAGKRSGAVSAFAIQSQSGELTFLNQQPTLGPGPCYITVDRTGRFALAANYGGGSVCVLPIREDGGLGEATAFVQHEGSSVDPKRQTRPYAHSINVSPDNRYAFAADLGIDKILISRFDATAGKLTPNDPPFVPVHPGSGPRHFTFHPNGRYAYLINELSNTVIAFAYEAASGVLREIQTISTLPADFKGTSYCAEVCVSPSGKFLYGSNRGHDSIARFSIDEKTGQLALLDLTPTGGKNPRHFAIDPMGNFLLVANQDTNNVVTFRLDATTGRLKATGQETQVAKPVCLKFATLGR